MDALKIQFLELIRMPAGDPSSSPEVTTIWILALLANTAAVFIVGKNVRSAMADSIPKAAIITAVSAFSILAALAISSIYIMPKLGSSAIRGIVPAAMVTIAISGITAPACKWLHKTKYSKALVTVLVSLVCAVGAIYVTRSGFRGARRGKASAVKVKEHSEKASEIMK